MEFEKLPHPDHKSQDTDSRARSIGDLSQGKGPCPGPDGVRRTQLRLFTLSYLCLLLSKEDLLTENIQASEKWVTAGPHNVFIRTCLRLSPGTQLAFFAQPPLQPGVATWQVLANGNEQEWSAPPPGLAPGILLSHPPGTPSAEKGRLGMQMDRCLEERGAWVGTCIWRDELEIKFYFTCQAALALSYISYHHRNKYWDTSVSLNFSELFLPSKYKAYTYKTNIEIATCFSHLAVSQRHLSVHVDLLSWFFFFLKKILYWGKIDLQINAHI